MKQEHWERIETILDTALTLSGKKRTDFINKECGNDEKLLREVKSMLRAIEESEKTRFLEGILTDSDRLVDEFTDLKTSAKDSFIGTKIGAFKVIGELGSGGMGNVYKAERVDGHFSQQVAIKLLQRNIRSEETIYRFRMEQEILASLKHSNIAQLYDGGITENGNPFLIMEYVDGVPIDRYCNDHQLSLDERLELFLEVCKAVQYAHANLVIHRDLKAQNIYVTNEGDVKVLDFGIAKLLDPKMTQQTLLETQPGQKLWTPQYAAPEQIFGDPVTVATDVYALGVLLYKLLTANYPLDLKGKSISEIEKIITRDQPEIPSKIIRDRGHSGFSMSYGKEDLLKNLKGDLDALILKALRKEPEYRYSTVNELIEDIERYRGGLPITARRDTVSYRIGKFVRRNKAGIMVLSVIFAIVVGLVTFYTWRITEEKEIAEQEAQKAEQISGFLTNLFERANPYGEEIESGLDTKLGTILELGSEKIETELNDQPEIQASLKTVIGETYKKLGEFEKAEVLLNDAVNILKNTDSKQDYALSLYHLAHVHQEKGDWKRADSLLQISLSIYEEIPGGLTSDNALTALSLYGNLTWFNGGNFDKADSLLSKSLSLRLEYYSEDEDKLATAYNDLAALNHFQGKFDKAEPYYRNAIRLFENSPGDQVNLGISMANFSILLRENGKLHEALDMQSKALNLFRKTPEQFQVDIALGHGNLAEINYLNKNYSKADSLATISISMLEDIYGPVHPYVSRTKLTIAKSLFNQRNYKDAEQLFLKVDKDYRKIYPADHPRLADPLLGLGKLYLELENYVEAEALLKKAYEIRRKGYSEKSWRTAIAMSDYGNCLSTRNKFVKADSLLNNAYDILKKEFGSKDSRVIDALETLQDHNSRVTMIKE